MCSEITSLFSGPVSLQATTAFGIADIQVDGGHIKFIAAIADAQPEKPPCFSFLTNDAFSAQSTEFHAHEVIRDSHECIVLQMFCVVHEGFNTSSGLRMVPKRTVPHKFDPRPGFI